MYRLCKKIFALSLDILILLMMCYHSWFLSVEQHMIGGVVFLSAQTQRRELTKDVHEPTP